MKHCKLYEKRSTGQKYFAAQVPLLEEDPTDDIMEMVEAHPDKLMSGRDGTIDVSTGEMIAINAGPRDWIVVDMYGLLAVVTWKTFQTLYDEITP